MYYKFNNLILLKKYTFTTILGAFATSFEFYDSEERFSVLQKSIIQLLKYNF